MTRSLLAVAFLAAGCGATSLEPELCDGGPCEAQVSWKKNYFQAINRNVDILFVVDDTAAIAPHQADLAAGFARLAQIAGEPIQPTSLHVGFIRAGSCDAGTRAGACGVTTPDQFMRSEWCGTMTNFGGPFTSTFGCLADLGAANCGPSQPLAAAAQLLGGAPRSGWEGFLRPDAYLLIVVVAGEDDASGTAGTPTPVADIAAALKGLKADPTQVVVSVVGPGDCAAAAPVAPRLTEFAAAFGANKLLTGLCSDGLAASLDRVFALVNGSIDPACVLNVRDTDLAQPGLQASCSVVDTVFDPRTGSATTTVLPNCDQGAPPCWRLVPNGTCAIFDIDRGADWCVEASTSGTVECLSCASPTDPACALTRGRP